MGRSDAMDRAVASFAMAYADRTIADHSELVRFSGDPSAKARNASNGLRSTEIPRLRESQGISIIPVLSLKLIGC
jgi:hypothetical protein